MTDAPEKIIARIYPNKIIMAVPPDRNFTVETNTAKERPYTRTDLADAAERAAYLRGLEDAAKVAEELAGCVVTPSPKPVYTNGFVTGILDAVAAIRALAEQARNETD